MLRRVLTLSILLALVSVTFGSAGLSADTKSVTDYDLKTLAIVVNRDSSDITVIDPVTDTIIKRSRSALRRNRTRDGDRPRRVVRVSS